MSLEAVANYLTGNGYSKQPAKSSSVAIKTQKPEKITPELQRMYMGRLLQSIECSSVYYRMFDNAVPLHSKQQTLLDSKTGVFPLSDLVAPRSIGVLCAYISQVEHIPPTKRILVFLDPDSRMPLSEKTSVNDLFLMYSNTASYWRPLTISLVSSSELHNYAKYLG